MTDTYSSEDTAPDAAAAPPAGAEGAKATQGEVHYAAGNPLKNCGLCEHFEGNPGKMPDGCEIVDGTISPFGICDKYLKQPNPFGDQHQYTMQGDQITPAAKRPPGLLTIGRRTYG